MDKYLKQRISYFRVKHGRTKAKARLIKAGLSQSMADKLLANCYYSKPDKFRMEILNKVLR